MEIAALDLKGFRAVISTRSLTGPPVKLSNVQVEGDIYAMRK